MDSNKPVFWHQGLFLQPQHFQLAEKYQQSLLYPYHAFQQPHFWGVCSLEMQSTSLNHRTCEIERGEFIFQDGTFVSLPENAVIESRSFESEWVDPEKPFTIYIAIHKYNRLGENVTIVNDFSNLRDINTRFISTTNPENIKDMYVEGPEAQVKFLRHVVKIVFDNEKGRHE